MKIKAVLKCSRPLSFALAGDGEWEISLPATAGLPVKDKRRKEP
ncbi:hypothetical protein FIV00_10150 [Labrenzia sp. THAF82]|nr:hypothetical protein FIV00_10150 [Labrenzia sp. THAF82]